MDVDSALNLKLLIGVNAERACVSCADVSRPPRRFTEDGCPHKKFFHTRYLMRMRLTPDCSKMLISTSSGYLLILHDLDLTQSLEVGSYRMLRARRTPLSSGSRRRLQNHKWQKKIQIK